MPLTPTNPLYSLVGWRNDCAVWMGLSGYSAASTELAAIINNAGARALDRCRRQGGWQWARREGHLTIRGPYSTGTVAVVVRSSTITGSSTAWNTNDAQSVKNVLPGDRFTCTGLQGSWKISAVGSDTSATLEAGFPGDTASGLSYTMDRDEYDLAAGMIWLESIREASSEAQSLTILAPGEWEKRTGGIREAGQPQCCYLPGNDPTWSGATSGRVNQRIRFWPAPDDVYGYIYTYLTVPTFPGSDDVNFELGPMMMDCFKAATMKDIRMQMGDERGAAQEEATFLTLAEECQRWHQTHTPRRRVRAWDRYGTSRAGDWLNVQDPVTRP